jgi:hypothetical protein
MLAPWMNERRVRETWVPLRVFGSFSSAEKEHNITYYTRTTIPRSFKNAFASAIVYSL